MENWPMSERLTLLQGQLKAMVQTFSTLTEDDKEIAMKEMNSFLDTISKNNQHLPANQDNHPLISSEPMETSKNMSVDELIKDFPKSDQEFIEKENDLIASEVLQVSDLLSSSNSDGNNNNKNTNATNLHNSDNSSDSVSKSPDPYSSNKDKAEAASIRITRSATRNAKLQQLSTKNQNLKLNTHKINPASSSLPFDNHIENAVNNQPIGQLHNQVTVQEVSCRSCHKSFENVTLFNTHECDTALNIKRHTCDQCQSTFSHPQHFKKHMLGHSRNNCKLCGSCFTKRKALCKHMKNEHQVAEAEKFYFCPRCEKKFIKRPSLYSHMREHAEGKVVCMKCGLMCDTDDHYSKHMLKHTEEANFKCDKCNETFIRRQQFEKHREGHDKYDCTLCDMNFSAKKQLMKHKRLTHGIKMREEKKHECNVCSKRFQRPMLLEMHMKIHNGNDSVCIAAKTIQCSHCPKTFRTQKALSKHLKLVNNNNVSDQLVLSTEKSIKHKLQQEQQQEQERLYLCAECGVKFFRKQGLFRHMQQLHCEDKPYTCPHCDYKCKCKTNLKRHIELHTKEKRYICELCGASFHAHATLKEHHAYVHSEVRDFVCPHCDKGFKGRSGLRRHIRSHSTARPYICDCGQSYKRMSHLKRHMISVHETVFKSKRLQKVLSGEVNLNLEQSFTDTSSTSTTETSTENNGHLDVHMHCSPLEISNDVMNNVQLLESSTSSSLVAPSAASVVDIIEFDAISIPSIAVRISSTSTTEQSSVLPSLHPTYTSNILAPTDNSVVQHEEPHITSLHPSLQSFTADYYSCNSNLAQFLSI